MQRDLWKLLFNISPSPFLLIFSDAWKRVGMLIVAFGGHLHYLIPCLIAFARIFHRHPAKTFNMSKVKSTMLVWCSVFVIYTCKSNTGALCFCWKEKQTENNRRNHRAVPAVQGFVQRRGRVSGRELSKFPWTSYKRESPSGCPGSRGRGVRVWAAQTGQAACFGWERCIWLDLVFSAYPLCSVFSHASTKYVWEAYIDI